VVSGPKKGTSTPRFLKVFSAKENHQRLIEEQAALVKQLAAHLGNRMEGPFPILFTEDAPTKALDAIQISKIFTTLSQSAEGLVSVADGIALSLTDDALAQPEVKATLHAIAGRLTEQANDDLEQIKRLRASSGKDESGAIQSAKSHNQKVVSALEADVYSLDEMVKRQRAENIRNIAEELSAARDRLQQLIEEYEKTKDPKLKEQIQREIERLEALLKTYQAELAKMQEEMPEEFFNLEALQPDEMENKLSKAKESIAKGDMSAARDALSQLNEALSDDQQKLDEEAARFGDAAQQKRDKEAEQLLKELSSIDSEERRILQETEAIEVKAREAAEIANKASIDAARSAAREKLNQLSALLSAIDADALTDSLLLSHASSVDRVEELDASLSTKALTEVIEGATFLQTSLSSYQEKLSAQIKQEEERNDIDGRMSALKASLSSVSNASKLSAEILSLLQKAIPSLSSHLSSEDTSSLAELQRAQRANQDKLGPLQEKMTKLSYIFGMDLKGIVEGGAPPENPGLPEEVKKLLSEAGQAMSDASKELGVAQPTPAVVFERTALQKLQELRQRIKDSGKKNRTQMKPQKVKIPTAEEFEPPRDYRDEVIEGSKEKDKASPKYQEALKKYYQELLQ
jgi:chromosome segregation ATPase